MAWVKRTTIERASKPVLLADHSKFGVRMMEVVCPFAVLEMVVSDEALGEICLDALRPPGAELRAA